MSRGAPPTVEPVGPRGEYLAPASTDTYDLVSQVQPGDRVLHWNSCRSPALLGWSEATGLFAHLPADGPETLVEDLKELLPDVLDPYAIAAAEYTLEWYADLAPDAAYRLVNVTT